MKTMYHHPSCEEYTACLQRGGSPFYSGSVMQRGYGIGGIFRGLATSLLPLLPKVGKFMAKTAVGVAADRLAGIPVAKSIKKRSAVQGRKLLLNAISNPQRKMTSVKRNKRRGPKAVKRIRTSGAFGAV